MAPISPRPLLLTLTGCLSALILLGQSPGFTLPAVVCPNTPVPEAVNMENISNVLSQPVFLDVVSEGGNYYGFSGQSLSWGFNTAGFWQQSAEYAKLCRPRRSRRGHTVRAGYHYSAIL